ncbi:hypothetical protein VTN77DRAFT_3539 [Rasamsonia byssochlamydoides]|uniref:uncharacterized protein n=1 Tax=Rasamsonia byssochlamydoides TaxID=89139 RepID=UPI0037427C62
MATQFIYFPQLPAENYACPIDLPTSYLNSRPPIITRVWSESRQVAFEKKARPIIDYEYYENIPVWLSINTIPDFWFNLTTDILDPLEAARGRRGASITSDLDDDPGYGWPDEEFNLLEGRKDYMVCLKMISLYIPFDQAVRSDLFGRLGEERIKLDCVQRWCDDVEKVWLGISGISFANIEPEEIWLGEGTDSYNEGDILKPWWHDILQQESS